MKIGILTFHRAYNYGAELQCYALTKYLLSLGYDVHVIDYYPSYFKREYSIFPYEVFKKGTLRVKLAVIVDFITKYYLKKKRKKGFLSFIRCLPLTKTVDITNISFDEFDVVFIGSDQIWNKKLTNGQDNAFSGFLPHKNTILASYAASTEYNDRIHDLDGYYQSLLKNFDFVSSREKKINDYFNTLIPNKSQWVLDPVMLLNKLQWAPLAVKPKETQYLLVYTVPMDPKVIELAEMIAKEKNLKIVELVSCIRYLYKKSCNQIATPEEFLGYFYNADYVVTTSFHGTAFSLRFEKQFSTLLLGGSVDNRAKDLLNNINLLSRAVDSKHLSIPQEEINYQQVTKRINALVQSSYNYINKVINFIK